MLSDLPRSLPHMRGRPQLRRRRADRATMTLRQLVSTGPVRAERRDPETLVQLHAALVLERQQLRLRGATLDDLEQNRLALVQCQGQPARALIERYLPPAATASAA